MQLGRAMANECLMLAGLLAGLPCFAQGKGEVKKKQAGECRAISQERGLFRTWPVLVAMHCDAMRCAKDRQGQTILKKSRGIVVSSVTMRRASESQKGG